MNAVGIDVSKGKSVVVVMRPFGEVVAAPFEVVHTEAELENLTDFLKSLPGETRAVMEYTGKYYQPVAQAIHNAGLFVSVVNPLLIYKYGNNSLRKGKTDKLDSVKIANYALDHWIDLKRYAPEAEIRKMLKTYHRQYGQYLKLKVSLKTNLITLLDEVFPGANTLFTSAPRKSDGHEKWVDFVVKFWHRECVCGSSEAAFAKRYQKWCQKRGYRFSEQKAFQIYETASSHPNTLPKTEDTKHLITYAVNQLNSITETLSSIENEMLSLASVLP